MPWVELNQWQGLDTDSVARYTILPDDSTGGIKAQLIYKDGSIFDIGENETRRFLKALFPDKFKKVKRVYVD